MIATMPGGEFMVFAVCLLPYCLWKGN